MYPQCVPGSTDVLPAVVFILTGRGTRHGYVDEWSADGTFRYFGERQKGDMTLTKGNKAIAEHAANCKASCSLKYWAEAKFVFAAIAAAGPARESKREGSNRIYRLRGEAIRQYVLARANGICESCDSAAPFKTTIGAPYLEPHHIRRLTDGGPHDPRFMGAVCPKCHREIHRGRNGQKRNSELLAP